MASAMRGRVLGGLAWAVLMAGLVAGCGDAPACVECTEATQCPAFAGTYYGEFSGVVSNCTEEPLLEGNTMVTVTAQSRDHDSDPATPEILTGAVVEIQMMNETGDWTHFTGSARVCADTEENAALPTHAGRTFHFLVKYEDTSDNPKVYDQMDGAYTPGDAAADPPVQGSFEASYSARMVDSEDIAKSCTVTATLKASLGG